MLYKYLPITDIFAREILDSRGNPTVETEVTLAGEFVARASVPSGASTGRYEAVELRDGEGRYCGLGVNKAVENVNVKIAPLLQGVNGLEQRAVDKMLIEADGTENKSSLGANAILSVSMAVARAAAKALSVPLYQYLGGIRPCVMPMPMMNVINGGKHAKNTLDFQEFMIVPAGAKSFRQGMRMGTEIYHSLKTLLKKRNLSTGVGDEGGFAPDVKDAKEVFELLTEAARMAGYEAGKDIFFAMDAAASELYNEETGMYEFSGETKMKGETVIRSTQDMIDYYEDLAYEYPIISIEDGLNEDDWKGWSDLTKVLGDKVQLVGDDLFVTNVKRLKVGIEKQAGNAILIKLNQIGTVSEAMDTIELAQKSGYRTIISHRSGETEDTFIADFAVAVNSGQIKTGAPCRMERVVKYNQLLRIEEQL
ncbi:MAG: phosphopyruvate hydratase [Lachnospiraceae bacterium]|nr:phosphopyruvate hydratase [Lachnospiraceae bacterium]